MSLSAWSNEDAASLGTLDRLVALRGTSEQPDGGSTSEAARRAPNVVQPPTNRSVGTRSTRAQSSGIVVLGPSSGIGVGGADGSSLLSGGSGTTTNTTPGGILLPGVHGQSGNREVSILSSFS